MTVQTTALRGDYTGNGVTVAFAVPFYFLENSHVQIEKLDTLTNVTTTLALTTDYTLAGAGVPTGGTATLLVAPLSTDKIAITRNVPYTQQTHYVEGDPFPSQSHEAALDKLTMLAQQLDEESSRSLKVPSSAAGFDGGIPAMLPSRLVATNAAGTGFELVAPSSGSAAELAIDLANTTDPLKNAGMVGFNAALAYAANTVGDALKTCLAFITNLAASSGSSLVGFLQSGAGAVARSVQDKGRDSVSVKDFGAVGNGIADDTAAFNAAKIAFPNGTIYVPNGTYRVNIDLSTEMIRMIGEGRRTTILKPAIDAPVISIGNMAGSYQGISLENLELEGVAGFASPGILFKNTPNINDYHKLERLHIRNFTNGIEILGRTIWSTMRDVEIASCSENGLYGHGANVLLNQLLVEHCTFEYTQRSGFKLEGQNPGITSTLKFLHCNFENCGLDASATDTAGCYVSNVHEVEFDNCYFESNSQTSTDNKGSGIRISGTYAIGVNIHGCLSWSTQNAIYNDASFTNGTYEGNRLAGTIRDVYVATTNIESMISLGSNVYGSKAAKLNFVIDANGLNHVSSFAPLCLTHSSSSSSATSAYNRGLINFTNSSPITVSNFTDGMPGQILILFNNGSSTVTLQHANTNGIYCPGGANYAMSAGKSATLVNDGTRGWVVTCTT